MPPVTPGAHCVGVDCDHDAAREAPTTRPLVLRGRRVRAGRHARSAATASTGRRARHTAG